MWTAHANIWVSWASLLHKASSQRIRTRSLANHGKRCTTRHASDIQAIWKPCLPLFHRPCLIWISWLRKSWGTHHPLPDVTKDKWTHDDYFSLIFQHCCMPRPWTRSVDWIGQSLLRPTITVVSMSRRAVQNAGHQYQRSIRWQYLLVASWDFISLFPHLLHTTYMLSSLATVLWALAECWRVVGMACTAGWPSAPIQIAQNTLHK